MKTIAAALFLALAACGGSTAATPEPAAPAAPTAPSTPSTTALRIELTKIYVDDLDKALRFYTDVLGFVAKDDESNGGYRWLTVASSADPDGTELQLAPNADPAAKAYQEAQRAQQQPAAMFFTSDVDAEAARLQALGAVLTMPPTDVTFAKIAMVDDGCGNLIQITQLY